MKKIDLGILIVFVIIIIILLIIIEYCSSTCIQNDKLNQLAYIYQEPCKFYKKSYCPRGIQNSFYCEKVVPRKRYRKNKIRKCKKEGELILESQDSPKNLVHEDPWEVTEHSQTLHQEPVELNQELLVFKDPWEVTEHSQRKEEISSSHKYNIEYFNAHHINFWQGIRSYDGKNDILLGTISKNDIIYGVLNIGPISYIKNNYPIIYPNSLNTVPYGLDVLKHGKIRIVGSYSNDKKNGFIIEGLPSELEHPKVYRTLNIGENYNYLHSTINGYIVGNCDNSNVFGDGSFISQAVSFLYNMRNSTYIQILYPGSITTTTYGICYNGNNNYTICGGYSNINATISSIYSSNGIPNPYGNAFIANWNSKTGNFSGWTTFNAPSSSEEGVENLTHFQGISTNQNKGYTLAANAQKGIVLKGFFLRVEYQNDEDSFHGNEWIELKYPANTITVSSNSVLDNKIVGIYVSGLKSYAFQAIIN